MTYSLAQSLTPRGIRVNCVAPGAGVDAADPVDNAEREGRRRSATDTPMGRPAQPDEIAPSYVFFAANALSSYYTGEVMAPIGGETLPG